MNKFANFIIKGRYWFLGIFFVLLVASAILSSFVTINYDLTNYLPNDSNTKQSIEKMKDEFGATGTANIMLKNVDNNQTQIINTQILQIDGVSTSIISKQQTVDDCNYALISIFLQHGDYTQEAENVLNKLQTLMGESLNNTQSYYLIGSAASACASRQAISNEIPIILVVAIAIVLVILLLTTRSWLEPIILLLVIGTAILINMGTNYLLGSISFVSNSIASVLLIALAMDYSIVLVNRFREERDKTDDIFEAMKKALSGSLVTIVASGLTVMAGLLSLIFMDYKIGLDMGLVLTKGVLISILAVIFLMPAILLLFAKLLKKTEHKSFLPGLKKIGTFAKITRFVFPILFVVLISGSFVIQNQMLNFEYVASSNESTQIYKDEKAVEEIFGTQNTLVILLDNTINNEAQKEMFTTLQNTKVNESIIINSSNSFLNSGENGIKLGDLLNSTALQIAFGLNQSEADYIISNVTTVSPIPNTAYAYEILKLLGTNTTIQQTLGQQHPEMIPIIASYYEREQLAEQIFLSQHTTRFIFNINAKSDSNNAKEYIYSITTYLNNSGVEYNIISNTQNIIETESVFKTDRLKVELISVIAILLIVLIAFKSASIPVILVLVIQGAIWINLASNALLGNSIFFICYLLGTAIQMGATIDYGILLTDRYIMARKKENKFNAIKTAIDKSFITIITSGSILTLAAFSIGIFSSTPLISSIGYLVGFGALCASITILFVLPQALLLLDKVIEKTTYKAAFYHEDNKQQKNKESNNKIVDAEYKKIEK